MTTWLMRFDVTGDGPRLAVKDCIDLAGTVTTAGCPVLAGRAEPATADAPVVTTARQAGARIVGKANLTELCWSADGVNEWSGTPVNPLDSRLLPGGSSSGSAVAVAAAEADVGYGTDTGGSVRVPAACCGIVGLKTSWGRIPLTGVYPLAPSLDTVGPLGRDVAAVELGMRLLEPGFAAPAAGDGPVTVGRLRAVNSPRDVEPEIDAAIDAALTAAGFSAQDVTGFDFTAAGRAVARIIDREGYLSNRHLLPDVARLREHNQRNMREGAALTEADLAPARAAQRALRAQFDAALVRYPVLALPTLPTPPPQLGTRGNRLTALTAPANLVGLPALSLPVPTASGLPASLQLIGPHGGEERLIAAGRTVEAALAVR